MQATGITTALSAAPTTTLTPTSRGLDSLKPEDFFKLLIAELQSQDPFKPNDSNQLVQEMSTIRQMDMSDQLNATLGAFAQQQRVTAATGMIGKYVVGTVFSGGPDGSIQPLEVTGVVSGVRFSSTGEAILDLSNGKSLPVRAVESVAAAPPPASV
jgi:flagellar basal-body rod modification protein FlgD